MPATLLLPPPMRAVQVEQEQAYAWAWSTILINFPELRIQGL